MQEAATDNKEKPVKGGKDQLAEVKSVVLGAMATKDADNAILLQRIQQRFERCGSRHDIIIQTRVLLAARSYQPQHAVRDAHVLLGTS